MRVIAGSARRIVLVAPKGLDTRPTSDIAKESLFNIISEMISGARFLDVFCGSGAIGIEALSRGAKEVVFIDNNSNAIKALNENLTKTKLTGEVLGMTAKKAIEKLNQENRKFDIIFSDPPYYSEILKETLQLKALAQLLAETGQMIAETETNTEIYVNDFLPPDTRIYGNTKFLFFKKEHLNDFNLSGKF